MRECFQNGRLLWFGQLKGMEEPLPGQCQKFWVDDSLVRGKPRKMWSNKQ